MEQAPSNFKKIYNNYIASLATAVIDYLNLSAFYTGYFIPYFLPALTDVLKQTATVALFPLAVLTSTLHTVFAWRNFHLDRDEANKTKKENAWRAMVNTASTVIFWAAIIIGIIIPANPAIGVIFVALFGLNLGITGIYNCLGAGFHFYQAHKKTAEMRRLENSSPLAEQVERERNAHLQSAKGHLFVGLTLGILTIAGSVVFLGGFTPFAVVGIATGIIGAAFSGYILINTLRQKMNGKSIETPLIETQEDSTDKKLGRIMPSRNNDFIEEVKILSSEQIAVLPYTAAQTQEPIEEIPLLSTTTSPPMDEPRRYSP